MSPLPLCIEFIYRGNYKICDNKATNDYEQRFTKLEIQIIDISFNMSILMVALESKFGPFDDFGGSKSKIGLEGNLEDRDDLEKETRKEFEKEKPSSSSITLSTYLFNMEVKVNINL